MMIRIIRHLWKLIRKNDLNSIKLRIISRYSKAKEDEKRKGVPEGREEEEIGIRKVV